MRLLRSCCCCSLRGGALAVGIVFLSFSVTQLLGVLIGWGAADAARASYNQGAMRAHIETEKRLEVMRRKASIPRETYQMQYIPSETSIAPYQYDSYLPGVEILAPMTILVLVQLTFDSLLVHGVRVAPKQPLTARRCLAAWLIFRTVHFGLLSLGALGLLITAIVFRYTYRMEYVSIAFGGNFVLLVVIVGLFWYAWAAVLSFYWRLRSADTGGITYSTVQMETTPMGGTSRDGALAEAEQEAAVGGQRDAEKWA